MGWSSARHRTSPPPLSPETGRFVRGLGGWQPFNAGSERLSAKWIHPDLQDEFPGPGSVRSDSVRRLLLKQGATLPIPFRRMECAAGHEAPIASSPHETETLSHKRGHRANRVDRCGRAEPSHDQRIVGMTLRGEEGSLAPILPR